MKRKPSEWEKIVANKETEKGLIFKIYKQLIQLNIRKTNNSIKKCAEDLNRHFSKEDIKMANKHEKMLNITVIREMQMQNCNKISLHTNQNGHCQNSTNHKCRRGCGE